MIYVPGVKNYDLKGDASKRRFTILIERIRERNQRYVRVEYTRILKRIYSAILELDHIPDMLEVYEIVMSSREAQEKVLRNMVSSIYPDAVRMAVPDDMLKSNGDFERKDKQSEIERRINDWLDANLGTMISSGYYDDMSGEYSDMWYIDESTLKDVRNAMDTAHGDPYVFQKEIERVLSATPQRAYTIARTECARATNVALDEAAKALDNGRPYRKVWFTIGGDRVRAAHKAMNDVAVMSDEMFQVPNIYGTYDTMEYPLDGAHGATAANIINCRCTCIREYTD